MMMTIYALDDPSPEHLVFGLGWGLVVFLFVLGFSALCCIIGSQTRLRWVTFVIFTTIPILLFLFFALAPKKSSSNNNNNNTTTTTTSTTTNTTDTFTKVDQGFVYRIVVGIVFALCILLGAGAMLYQIMFVPVHAKRIHPPSRRKQD